MGGYAKGHKWPDLRLFDLSDLLDVGITLEPTDRPDTSTSADPVPGQAGDTSAHRER